ncbi:serine-enriched protein [Gigaspora margarita]|uniref:Serine-enriched protein n=1 Tax=Gigaspora margarita TaxID=4874 RepID=A0A8H3X0L8_GIGMA|nr:serine-enriched protein [Gigaspora margarita]
MATKFFEKLSNNYIKLFESEDYNVIIEVGKSPNTKEFKAHYGILKYRSLYFHNKLNKKESNNIIRIKLNPNISIQYFEIMIRYIYGGVFSLENLDASSIFDIMIVASKLLLEELVKHLETHLIEVEAHWLHSHFTYVYKISFGNNQLQELQKWSNNIVVKYPNIIFESEEFTLLQENSLISLIKRDNLQLKEIEIWNYIIKWGIAKNPELPSELKD